MGGGGGMGNDSGWGPAVGGGAGVWPIMWGGTECTVGLTTKNALKTLTFECMGRFLEKARVSHAAHSVQLVTVLMTHWDQAVLNTEQVELKLEPLTGNV